ncbi:MAG: LysR family transcriptional regulator [Phycisphaerae bacterium]
MNWLNYHHLLYFWTVVRAGGVTRAAEQLSISQPTVSTQLKQLEKYVGEKLFERSQRKLELTEMGRTIYGYADEIFRLGHELDDVIRRRPTTGPLRLGVGLTGSVPKLVGRQLIEPALKLSQDIYLDLCQGTAEALAAQLADFSLDVVLADEPPPRDSPTPIFGRPLIDSGVSVVGSPRLIQRHQGRFPACLNDAPLLLPATGSPLRKALDVWLAEQQVRPRVVGEMQDTAMLKAFGETGFGFFPTLTIIEKDVCSQYDVALLGRTTAVSERFYAWSVQRKVEHPAVVAICKSRTDNQGTTPPDNGHAPAESSRLKHA